MVWVAPMLQLAPAPVVTPCWSVVGHTWVAPERGVVGDGPDGRAVRIGQDGLGRTGVLLEGTQGGVEGGRVADAAGGRKGARVVVVDVVTQIGDRARALPAGRGRRTGWRLRGYNVPLPPLSALSTAPPSVMAQLTEKVELVMVAVPVPLLSTLSMAPPSAPAELPEKVESVTVRVPLPLWSPLSMAPPSAIAPPCRWRSYSRRLNRRR